MPVRDDVVGRTGVTIVEEVKLQWVILVSQRTSKMKFDTLTIPPIATEEFRR